MSEHHSLPKPLVNKNSFSTKGSKEEIAEIRRIAGQVDGHSTDKEGELLYNLARNCEGGAIVEIGSWKGKSTIWLAKGAKRGNNVKVYSIDDHSDNTFEEFTRNVQKADVDDTVNSITKLSFDAVKEFDEPVQLIFIDGGHEYEYVRRDFDEWFPKVKCGGVMAFHDTTGYPGVRKVVEELVLKSRYFRAVSFLDSIAFGQKVAQNTFAERIRNRYVLLLLSLYYFAHDSGIPQPIRQFMRLIGKPLMRLLAGSST